MILTIPECPQCRQSMESSPKKTTPIHEPLSELERLRLRIARLEAEIAADQMTIAALQQSEKDIRFLLDQSSDPIFTFYRDGTYRYVNLAFANGVGRKLEEITGHKIWDVFSKEEADKRYSALKWVFDHGETRVIEVRVPLPTGDTFYLTTIKPLLDQHGEVEAVICISKDITDRKRMEDELRRASMFDSLTGVYNRNYFEMELKRLQVNRRFPVSIVLADVDGLKEINDKQGHEAGDVLLRQAAQSLQQIFRTDDQISRIGGDEFAIILPTTTEEMAARIVTRLREHIAQAEPPFNLSIGVATEWQDCNLLDVMRQADERMYKEKRERKNN